MKKILFILAALMFAGPALAAVDITCSDEGDGVVAVYYDAGTEGSNSVRAFALDISISDGNIAEVNDTDNLDFWVNPGTIQIADGIVTNEGTSVAPGGDPDSCSGDPNCRTIEMATLYVGANEPDTSALLLKFTVDTSCTVTIVENETRGKVVSEAIVDDPGYEVTVNSPGCAVTVGEAPCYTGPDFAEWVAVGEPDSWCCETQCHGDADCAEEAVGRSNFRVGYNDITILLDGLLEVYGGDPAVDTWIAADFDHAAEAVGRSNFRVGYNDITELLANLLEASVATDCQTP